MRDFLHELAVGTADEFDGASAGVAVVRDGRLTPVAASDGRAQRLESAGRNGPHAVAAERSVLVDVRDVGTDGRWPGFAERALREGIHSVVIQPIEIDDTRVPTGLLTVYSTEPCFFDSADRLHRVGRLAAEAGRALALATRLSASERASWDLEQALTTRATIDQAIGILMAQQGCNAQQAFEILRSASQNRNTKLRVVADEIVTTVGGPPSARPTFRP